MSDIKAFITAEDNLYALEALASDPQSETMQAYMRMRGYQVEDYSVEGIIDNIKSVVRLVYHKMFIAVNKAWARLTHAHQDVIDAIRDVEHRPNADLSKLPLGHVQVAAIATIFAATGGILALLAAKGGKVQYDKYRADQAEKQRMREREEKLRNYKAQIKQAVPKLYRKGVEAGKWLNKETTDLNTAINGVKQAHKLVTDGISMVNKGYAAYSRAPRSENAEDAHHASAEAREYAMPSIHSTTKALNVLRGAVEQAAE